MHQLHVMLSEKDYAHLKEQQRRSGLSASALIRSLLADLEIKERPTEMVMQVCRELNAIGNNLNQLVKLSYYHPLIEQDALLVLAQLKSLISSTELVVRGVS